MFGSRCSRTRRQDIDLSILPRRFPRGILSTASSIRCRYSSGVTGSASLQSGQDPYHGGRDRYDVYGHARSSRYDYSSCDRDVFDVYHFP